ncbi:short-chain dehydrogenase/reductase SDR [Rhodoferax ferrireducens T118]|uniref:Short-chain dehydrogenase/reductase SDR n=1 Tax=Albidiferax ferrireducens (strain ATCC BAA-621 / DSM 15236 / T118) TaxID=338969 RepID=Q21Z23_ALBFT|nr:short-chain dehydrogenase/reductase SDR [Rhodoferax ferrireducens T118]
MWSSWLKRFEVRFINKKVFVTGASRGIGQGIAEAFRAEGAWVIGTRTGEQCAPDEVCNEWFSADFTQLEQIAACAEFVRKTSPDVLVNNAGINKNAPFVDIDPDMFRTIQQVNVVAPFMLCQAAIPSMKQKGWGRIVNISSIWGKISMAHRASYSASKFALDGMTVALAAEHSIDGIIANSIAPGFIDTDLTHHMLGDAGIKALVSKVPANRLGQVSEIARLVLWLASEENTFIAGQNVAIDGGFTRV